MKFSKLKGVFSHREEYRSDSENGRYVAAVIRAVKSQEVFDQFKRDSAYREILEHVSEEQGREYLDVLLNREDGLLERALATVLMSDDLGNPFKYAYDSISEVLSPTTLRYVKVASDLKGLFGENLGRTVEIGCGYGGQALINDQLLKVELATLLDLPYVNDLIDRYLNSFLFNGAYSTAVINKVSPYDYDLIISNYAFSELPEALQIAYINKTMVNAKRGYLTMNSGLGCERSKGKLSLNALRELLPSFDVYEEKPLTFADNYLIVWGHDRKFAESNFTLKEI